MLWDNKEHHHRTDGEIPKPDTRDILVIIIAAYRVILPWVLVIASVYFSLLLMLDFIF